MKAERGILLYSLAAAGVIVMIALAAYWHIAQALNIVLPVSTGVLFCALLTADIQLDIRCRAYRAIRRYLLGAAWSTALYFAQSWPAADALAAPLICAALGWLLWRPADSYARSWPTGQ